MDQPASSENLPSEGDEIQSTSGRRDLIGLLMIVAAIFALIAQQIIIPRLTSTQAERDAQRAESDKKYEAEQAAKEAAQTAKKIAKENEAQWEPMSALDGILMVEGGGDITKCKTTYFYNQAYEYHSRINCDWGPTKRYEFHEPWN
jgi:hypothetical protein